jgi:hypothetical protein
MEGTKALARQKIRIAVRNIAGNFLLTLLMTVGVLSAGSAAHAATYALSTDDPQLVFSGSMSAIEISGGAAAEAGGIYYYGSGTVTNNGTIRAGAANSAPSSGSAKAYGINAVSGSSVNNSGSITAVTEAFEATAYGIYSASGPVVSSGSIAAHAYGTEATAYGVYSLTGSVTNSGEISVGATSNSTALTYGIRTSGNISNSGDISALSTSIDSPAMAYGLYGASNTITNSGTVIAMAHPNNSDSAAYGISASGGSVTNSGAIIALAVAQTSEATAKGISILSGTVTNTGTIYVITRANSANSFGIYSTGAAIDNSGNIIAVALGPMATAYGISASGGSVTNSGIITVSAYDESETLNLDTALDSAPTGSVTAYGIHASSPVINTGDITVSARGLNPYAYGICTSVGQVVNSGNITVNATVVASAAGVDSASVSNETTAHAYGISAGGTVYNSGNINITADGEITYAYGIYNASASTSNNGDISVVSHSDGFRNAAYGIYSSTGSINNSGNISAATNGGYFASANGVYNATGTSSNEGNISVSASGTIASAYGIRSETGAVTNSGRITATASISSDSDTALSNTSIIIGAQSRAYGIYSSGTVDNSGVITVSASGNASAAYGIYMTEGTLTNTGVIHAAADNAYEVYVNGAVSLVDRYNMTLDGDPAKGSIYVLDGATLNLNSALFSVSTASDTRFNTEYRIFAGEGTVNGSFGGLIQPTNPAVSLLYHDQGTSGSSDDTVSLSYHPRSSTALKFVDITRRLLDVSLEPVRGQQLDTFLWDQLFGSGPVQFASSTLVAGDAPSNMVKRSADGNAYLIPYYSKLRDSSSALGYSSDVFGIAAGYDRRFGNLQLGVHTGYARAETNFRGTDFPSGTNESQHVFSLGLQGMGRWGDWTLRGDATGFYGWHEYNGVTGLYFEGRENAAFKGYGTTEQLMLGRLIRLGGHVLLPEIGLNHSWIRQDGFNTGGSFGAWRTNYSSVDDNRLDGVLTVRWLTRLLAKGYSVIPSVAVGGKYRLTGDDVSIQQTVPGSSPVTVTANDERAAATASVGLAVKRGDVSAELAYTGEYSKDTILHGAWFKLIYSF